MNGYYFAIYKEETVVVKYIDEQLFMCGINMTFVESDFDDIDFENAIHFL